MLEPVVLHQTRFNSPGLAPDSRGIAIGRECGVLLPSLDALVGFFRVLTDEIALDDILPSLRIHEVEGGLGSREWLVRFEMGSSHLGDRAARIAALTSGLCFTGSGKQLVKYRDSAAPLGYDVAAGADVSPTRDVSSMAAPEVILHAPSFTQGYRVRRELPFAQLVFRLSPRRVPGPIDRDLEGSGVLWLLVERGLARSVLVYLYRNRVAGRAVAVVRSTASSKFAGAKRRGLLVRVEHLPQRMARLLSEVPGIRVQRPVDGAPHVVVEVGHRHPLRLESCLGLFDRRRFYVFGGRQDEVEVLAADLAPEVAEPDDPESPLGMPLVAIDRLVAGDFLLEERGVFESAAARPERLRIALALVPSSLAAPGGSAERELGRRVIGRHAVAAVLVPWERIDWLRRLVFLLPPGLIAHCRAAAIDEGFLIVATQSGPGGGAQPASHGSRAIDRLPVGELLYEAGPSILAPIGYELSPRVAPEVLVDLVGGVTGRQLLLRPGDPAGVGVVAAKMTALAISDGLFEPLSRRLLARIPSEPAARSARLSAAPASNPPTVTNDAVGVFPLWGYRRPRDPG